jgi:uncharacterized DUF497 family protein
MEFIWHDKKREANLLKHKIDFSIALTIFADDCRMEKLDNRQDYGEERIQTIGKTDKGDLLFLTYTMREGACRIISARPANNKEKKLYYDND